MRFPINDSSVSSLLFVEANASLMSLVKAVFYLQVGIPSYSECLCTNLGIYCAWLVVPPPPVSFRKVDHLVSVVLMAVVVRIVYG